MSKYICILLVLWSLPKHVENLKKIKFTLKQHRDLDYVGVWNLSSVKHICYELINCIYLSHDTKEGGNKQYGWLPLKWGEICKSN